MADDGSKQRKPDFRSAVEDVKALATVLVMKLESVLGRRLKLRSPAVLAAIGIVATLVLALVVVMVLLQAGDANAVSDNAALIAALVALGGVFTAQMVSIALDDRRSHEARDLEAQRAGEAALQNYFEQVGKLLIEIPLHRAGPGDNLSTVVRAQTLSVLEGLDPDRKRILLLFLYESGLIYKDKLVVSLEAADLRQANLIGANLIGANLDGANLDGANLRHVHLSKSNLRRTSLREAELNGAYLREADLRWANLGQADLSQADLSQADLSQTELTDAKLSHAKLSHGKLRDAALFGADLRQADLSGAYLEGAHLRPLRRGGRGANLSGAHLGEANLSGAYLGGANLSGAALFGADLSGVDISNEQVEQQAVSLMHATMPDGQKYEDWLRDKEGSGKDVENE